MGAHRQQLEILTAKFWERNGNAKAFHGPCIKRQGAKKAREAVLDKISHSGWAGG